MNLSICTSPYSKTKPQQCWCLMINDAWYPLEEIKKNIVETCQQRFANMSTLARVRHFTSMNSLVVSRIACHWLP
jgi:hypothetical protein